MLLQLQDVLTTEAVIVDVKEDAPAGPPQGMVAECQE